ncbi:hypothetical protein AJ79_05333 [Helicocarpus griseus UAMH5409]|uniref:Uncharacterized protein n=1 Tax=Helicocarpus griseus UAMH5409 TaxID=1447875 RepID=A0A2B7XQ20_9EURO|nr:hypothetical protein AJ79_05333 [Helicocarpus griseus UAMH5409]
MGSSTGGFSFLEKSQAYEACEYDLAFNRAMFFQMLHILLLCTLAVDDEKRETLVNDPGGEAWDDPEIVDILEAKLLSRYDLIIETIITISNKIKNAERHLGRVKREKVATESVRLAKNQRLKLGFFKWISCKAIFKRLREENDRLGILLDGVVKTEKNRVEMKAITPEFFHNQNVREFWKHTTNLHHGLSKDWGIMCPGDAPYLELKWWIPQKVEFDVLF